MNYSHRLISSPPLLYYSIAAASWWWVLRSHLMPIVLRALARLHCNETHTIGFVYWLSLVICPAVFLLFILLFFSSCPAGKLTNPKHFCINLWYYTHYGQ